MELTTLTYGLSAPALEERDKSRARKSTINRGLLTAVSVGIVLCVVALIGTIVIRGAGAITWEFLSQGPRNGMAAGGIWPMIRGSLLLLGGSLLIVIPVSVLAGVFLGEYAGTGKWVEVARALITSLAGTPSIVFGLFGLAIFVLMMKMGVSLMAGWFTVSLMAMPVVVLNTEQAIRSVPHSSIDGALALGLTRWQAIWRVVLPQALPGIMTGIVLATGRAAGEAPPILLTCGIYYSTTQPAWGMETLKSPIANLPYHIAEAYRQPGVIPEKAVWGTCLVLLSMALVINMGAIVVRAKARKSKQA